MGEYFFGLGPGWLPKRADTIARKHGATLTNHTDSQCSCGRGCKPCKCTHSRRHWFSCSNMGNPHDQRVQAAVLNALAESGILKG